MANGQKVRIEIDLTPQQAEQLKLLCEATALSLHTHLHQALEDLLARNAPLLRRAAKLSGGVRSETP